MPPPTTDPPVTERPPLVAAELRNASGLAIELLDNGAVLAIRLGDILVNQVLGSPVEGGIGNVYLRRRTRGGIRSVPLIGPAAQSGFRASDAAASWEGSADGLAYSCTLRLAAAEPTWFWTVRLRNVTRRRISVDALLAQDLGIAEEASVRANELYASQYIDQTVLEDEELGFLVCSRQNLSQAGRFPWLMQGCLQGTAGYLTDGFQFYGLGYRASDLPAALARPNLPNRICQYEFALPTLQSRRLALAAGATGEITFFASLAADHPAATGPADARQARAAEAAFRTLPTTAVASPARKWRRKAGFMLTTRKCASSVTIPFGLDSKMRSLRVSAR